MKSVLGIKKGMTRVFKGDKSVAVTILDTEGCVVSALMGHGYELGIGKKKQSNAAMVSKYKALGFVPKSRRFFRDELDGVEVGKVVDLDSFVEGVKVKIVAKSKGKGFAGVVKRWGFHGGPKTHGQSNKWRAPGSIGAGTTPGRVLKGKKMAGRMGGERVTIRNKSIVGVQGRYVLVSGSVPGNVGDVVSIKVQKK